MKNKVIVVTGGSGLIGKSIMHYLKRKHAIAINVDITCDDNLEDLQLRVDITKTDQIKGAIQKIVEKYGRIDGFVNNAYPKTADWGKSSFVNSSDESWRNNVDWQLNSYALASREILKQMLIQKSGSIIFITSIYGVVGNDPELYKDLNMYPPAAYTAIKGGIVNFARYLAAYYGAKGIRVNCISPGGIYDKQNNEFVKRYNTRVPLKRMGIPEDIAPIVSFIMSDEASYITGQNIIVDGGWTCI